MIQLVLMDLKNFVKYKVEKSEDELPLILWNHRWEYDKNPALFFDALSQLTVDFNLSVIGESFRNTPPLFDDAKEQFKDQIGTIFQQFSAELEMEIQKGNIRPVSPLDLVFSRL